MAAFEVIALDTATPQLRAPGASDTYTFPRAVEMPLGTANGVLYLNGSKVVTSGSALTFDGTFLQLSGAYFANSGAVSNILAADSTSAFFDTSSSVYPFRWLLGGSEQMRLTSTGLGIGTNNPAYKLDVSGTDGVTARVKSTSGTTGNYAQLILDSYNSFSGTGQAYIRGVSSVSGNSNTDLTFGVNSSGFGAPYEAMRLDASGNLGLGVTPSGWGGGIAALELKNGSSLFNAGGSSQTLLSANGFFNGTNWIYKNSAAASYYNQNGGAHAWLTAASGTAGNAISFTQAMTLDASGNLGVGTTSPDIFGFGSAWRVLGLNNSGASGSAIQLTCSATSAGSIFGSLAFGSSGSTAADKVSASIRAVKDNSTQSDAAASLQFFTSTGSANTERARITSGGNFVVGTAALATTATDGFLYVPTCAGTPTGTPTTQTGTAPIVVDTTNNKLYFYSGGQWRDAGP